MCTEIAQNVAGDELSLKHNLPAINLASVAAVVFKLASQLKPDVRIFEALPRPI